MDNGVDPFAPALQAFAHPFHALLRMLRDVGGARADEIAESFVLKRKSLQRAKENRGQWIIALSEAIEALEQAMKFLLVRIAKNSDEAGLRMTFLHGRTVRAVALSVAGSSVPQELA